MKKKKISNMPKVKKTVGPEKSILLVKKNKLSNKNSKKENKLNKEYSPTLAETFKPKIKVIGIGGGGGSIVSEIGRSLEKATFVIADTDIRSFKKKKGIKHFIFGQELTHGLGTGLNVELAEEAAQREKEKISHLFKDQDIMIFITCLGGGLGSGATKVFLDSAKDFSGITFGIFTLPFKFEGSGKHKIALKAQRELRRLLNVSITIPNERIFKVIDENTPIVQAFSMVNKNLIESLESLIDLIQSPGLINIDFADLRAILQGRGNLAFLNTAEASGSDKAEKVIASVLHNQLYQDHFLPEKVLFNIEGGKNLSMFEVDKISKAISEKNSKAKIIFGISKNAKFKNKIKTTLLMTGPMPFSGQPEKIAKKTVVSKEKVRKAKPLKLKVQKSFKKAKKEKQNMEKLPISVDFMPEFANLKTEEFQAKKISISEKTLSLKKNLRRSALEIQKAEELESETKSKQEEEWEIPAFLRFKKIK
ncbi:MAG: hypothetical protein FJZ43_00300 [Candidatus Staskawiczbacteria bacterium]|nr:hypothetical protein [Candidatus Staskawiczbacteria bacterium]